MSAPDFNKETIETLAARAAHICSNPTCSLLTIGPSDKNPNLKLKVGEAAHIYGARKKSARYLESMTDAARADISNGIWLCAKCHTLIDKNKGVDFKDSTLIQWKTDHEKTIGNILMSNRSPMPLLRRFSNESKIAQDIVDLLENHGALYQPFHMEVPTYVVQSFDKLRDDLGKILKRIKLDGDLREIVKEMRKELRVYMNLTGAYNHLQQSELMTARNHIGIQVSRLRDNYGAKIGPELNKILP